MDTIISLTGDDFSIIAINTSCINSIVFIKEDLDKFIEIGKNNFIAVSGYPGDVAQFTDFIQKTVLLHSLRSGFPLSTHNIANCIRKEISECLRKNPFKINILLVGFDRFIGSSLYSIDYLGTLQRMDYCVQGYASFFLFSFLDRRYKPKMRIEEVLDIIIQSTLILKKRFIVNQINFLIKIVDSKGCRNVGII
nr:26S proteasome chain protein [Cryptomonas curvata]